MNVQTRALAFILAILLSGLAVACGDDDDSPGPSGPPPAFSTTDLRVGTGAAAATGSRVTVHYTGWLYEASAPDNKGRQFDSNVGETPLSFTLGANQVIPGFDLGIQGMRVGGQRRVVIPSELGYGVPGNPPSIPSNAALVFEVELLDVS